MAAMGPDDHERMVEFELRWYSLGGGPATEIREQITLRAPYYLQAADIVVPVDERTVTDIVDEIVRHLSGPGPDQRDPVPIA